MTWILKSRGDSTAPIVAEYECPVHGRFEAIVARPSPDVLECPTELDVPYIEGHTVVTFHRCCQPSPFRFPMPRGRTKPGEIVTGKVMDYPPENVCLDTRALADDPSPSGYAKWKEKQSAITRDEGRKKSRARHGATPKAWSKGG